MLDLYEYPELPREIQNLRNPDIVERIHREYVAAGAEIIQTNTMSGNRYRLAQYHLEDRVVPVVDPVYLSHWLGPDGVDRPSDVHERSLVRDLIREPPLEDVLRESRHEQAVLHLPDIYGLVEA